VSPTDHTTSLESRSLFRPGNSWIDRRMVVLLSAGLLILAVIRFSTSAVDPWEWDEILFTQAVQTGIDVRVHHPHPPGYPLFVYPAQVISALGVEPFRAATIVGVVGGLLSVVATGTLLAALGASLPIAVLGAALYAFVPSVWLHAVRPLTDGLGAAAFAFGAAFFVWSYRRRSPTLFAVATLVATLGAGVRPQAGALLAPVAVFAAWRVVRVPRGLLSVMLTALGAALLSLLIWAPVVRGSGGWDAYRATAKAQADYILTYDAPKPREFLHKDLWTRWWVDPFGARPLAYAVYALGLAGLVTRRREAATLLGLFLPLAFLSMALLDKYPGPRYANAFLALPPMLAALGVDGIATATGRFRCWVSAALGVPLVAALAWGGLRPILLVASVPSPSVAAMERLRDAPEWKDRPVAFGGSLVVHAQEFLHGRPMREIDDDAPMDLPEGQAIVIADRLLVGLEPAEQFSLSDPLLPRISRGRYLKVSLYRGLSQVALAVPRVEGNGWWDGDRGLYHAGKRSALLVSGPHQPLGVGLTVAVDRSEETPPRFRFETLGDEREFEVRPGETRRVELETYPDPSGFLFRLRCLSGGADIGRLVFSPRPDASSAGVGRVDNGLPTAVDEPAEGAEVRGALRARGWCSQAGGGAVDPVEFRLDGALLARPAVLRFPRPDVAAAVPWIGTAELAGWEAVFQRGTASAGDHSLVVTFRTPDGRTRAYPARRFRWEPAPAR
jgi:hypothetical protein